MSYYIIIRGPAGVGKSMVAKKLSKLLSAYYIPFDDVMKKHGLDTIEGDGIKSENFVKANMLVIPKAKPRLENDEIVVFDGCFYRAEQIEHLIKNLPYNHYIFSLEAPLKECLIRNKKRMNPMTNKAIIEVFNLVSKIDIGIKIQTSGKTIEETVETTISKLSTDKMKKIG